MTSKVWGIKKITLNHLLGQWLHFKLFGITYLVGKIKFKLGGFKYVLFSPLFGEDSHFD